MIERLFSDLNRLEQAAIPADLNGAAVTGARIKMDKGFKVAIVATFGDSTGAVVTLTLKQHDAAAAGNSKVLEVETPYFVNPADTAFTKTQPSAAYSAVDAATELAASEGIVVIEVPSEALDSANGYDWFSVDVADSTAAKLMGALYVIHDMRQIPAYDQTLN